MRVAQEENRESTDADHVSTEELDWAVAKIHQEDQSVLRELAERESVEPQLQTLHFIHFAHKRLALTPTLTPTTCTNGCDFRRTTAVDQAT
jgi:hypothetical protein